MLGVKNLQSWKTAETSWGFLHKESIFTRYSVREGTTDLLDFLAGVPILVEQNGVPRILTIFDDKHQIESFLITSPFNKRTHAAFLELKGWQIYPYTDYSWLCTCIIILYQYSTLKWLLHCQRSTVAMPAEKLIFYISMKLWTGIFYQYHDCHKEKTIHIKWHQCIR